MTPGSSQPWTTSVWQCAAIFVAAFVVLGIGVESAGIASLYTDPVSGIRAQDESIYVNSALTMAAKGDWMTPKVLGRVFLYKPPLLLWLSGLSVKILGLSLFAVRLPSLLAGALGVLAVFLWCREFVARSHALAAAVLLLSNAVWHTLSRLCYTDVLLSACIAAAMCFLARDPQLTRRSSLWGFSLAAAAGVMTKNIAGLLSVFVLVIFLFLLRPGLRQAATAVFKVCLLVALFIAPWHLYQLLVHPQWFWMDYVKLEIFHFGLEPTPQPWAEIQPVFYLRRIFLTDPVLVVLAVAALPRFVAAIRRRSVSSLLLASWLAVMAGALVAFQARSFPYIVFLLPPLAILAAAYAPLGTRAYRVALVPALFLVFAVKAMAPEQLWGLAFGKAPTPPASAALRAYCELRRPNELVLVDTDDNFYSAVLPLPKVRYLWIDPQHIVERYAPHYPWLGITVTTTQFAELSMLRPVFLDHLRAWGLNSAEPLATAIVADSDDEALAAMRSAPYTDFYVPLRLAREAGPLVSLTHQARTASLDRVFLLARKPPPDPAPQPQWKIPASW